MILRLMIELDMLLDTRIAAVSQLNQQAAIDLLTPAYRQRISDDLGELTPLITTEEFKKKYALRNKETLMWARPTPMLYFFCLTVNQNVELSQSNENIEEIEIDINTYPYDLNDEEKDEICACLLTYINYPVVVRTIFMPPYALTINEIKLRQWTSLYMYNFRDWAESIIPNMTEATPKIPSVFIVAPELLKTQKELPAVDDMKMPNGQQVSPHQAVRILLSPFISIRYAPVEHVSLAELPPFDETVKSDENAPPPAEPNTSQENDGAPPSVGEWEEL